LFLGIIFFENPTEVIEKLSLLDNTVSPPHRKILYFFCSWFKDLVIFFKFMFEKVFLLPEPEIK